jgi:hypothetical protein
MAYPHIPAGYALIRHRFTCPVGVGHAATLYGVKLVGTPTAVAVANEQGANWTATILTRQSSLMTYFDVTAVVNNAGVLSEAVLPVGSAGGGGAVPVAPQVAVLIKKTSGVIGKAFRGRIYVPYCQSNDFVTENDRLNPTQLTAWQGVVTTLFNDEAADTFSNAMVLLHRNVLTAPTAITALTVEQTVATQRRRQRKAAHR